MKRLFKPVGILAFMGVFAVSCNGQQQGNATEQTISQPTEQQVEKPVESSYVKLRPAEFNEALKSETSPLLIDIRSPGECASGVIEGARIINYYDEDFSDQMAALDLDQTLFFYCRSGNRSGSSAPILQQLGARDLIELDGGLISWQKAGFVLVKP